MPTVLRYEGFDIMIYTHDHLPMHVHVFNADGEAIINLKDITVRERRGMKNKDVRRAQKIVADNQTFLQSEWERIKPIP